MKCVVHPGFHGEEVSCEQWKLIFYTVLMA